MAFSVGTVEATIGANMKPFEKAMSKVRQAGDKISSMGMSMTAKVSAPLAGLSLAMLKGASDAKETSAKFSTVFSDISAEAEKSAKVLNESFGLSSNASKELLSDTGDLLTGFGFTQESALGLSEEVNKLAVDLASFTNFSGGAEGASKALTKALLGERESVKSLGISILEADVQAKMLENSQKGLTFETDRQAKAFATLKLAQEQSKNAIGDFARTQDGLANKTRTFMGDVRDLSDSFGKLLIPIATKVVSIASEMVSTMTRLSDRTKKIILAIAGIATAIGPTLLALGGVIKLLPLMAAGFAALTSPIGLVVAALAGVSIGITYLWDNWSALKERISDIGWWRNAVIDMAQFLLDYNPLQILIKSFNSLLRFLGQSEIPNPLTGLSSQLEKLKGQTAEYQYQFGSMKRALINGFDEITGINLSSIFSSGNGDGVDNGLAEGIGYASIKTKEFGLSVANMTAQTVPMVGHLQQKMIGLANAQAVATDIGNTFANSFGQGMSNVIVQGDRLIDVLENIGKLLLSSAIQKGLSILLSGGLGGGGFFGSGGGLIGNAISGIFGGSGGGGGALASPVAASGEMAMTRAFKSAMDQKMNELTPEAVWIMGEKGRLGI